MAGCCVVQKIRGPVKNADLRHPTNVGLPNYGYKSHILSATNNVNPLTALHSQ